MANDPNDIPLSPASLIGIPEPGACLIEDPELRREYQAFVEQLQVACDGRVIISNPYQLSVDTRGISDSVPDWYATLSAEQKAKLYLLLLFSRPFDESKLKTAGGSGLFDRKRSLSEGATNTLLESIDQVAKDARFFNGPHKALVGCLPCKVEVATMSGGFWNTLREYVDEAWQVGRWSDTWGAVYGLTDAGDGDGYAFPWLLGFCRLDNAVRNFVDLLRGGNSDPGFYCTLGPVTGPWPLAAIALTAIEGGDFPPWDQIDWLRELDDATLDLILADTDGNDIIAEIQDILEMAEELGLESSSPAELFEISECGPVLSSVRERLQELLDERRAWEDQVDKEKERILAPYRSLIDAWAHELAGPSPTTYASGMAWSGRLHRIQHFIEDHLIMHGQPPTGRQVVDEYCPEEIDFDGLARRIPWHISQNGDEES